MVKRSVCIGIIFLLAISLVAPAYCEDNALKKLGRGVCNCVTFPFEIFNQVGKTNNTDGPFAAMTFGLIKGVAMTGLRAVVGVYEVASFPLPLPDGYKPILTDPEFFFEGMSW